MAPVNESEVNLNRPAVNDAAPPHKFVPSEFAPDLGRCDVCGGGPLAEIHKQKVDHLERIANALEAILEILRRESDSL